jgi:osmotically-inducible protein OsmY
MSRLKPVALVLILASTLAGCATYRMCGFAGCPGDSKITANVHALLDQYPELQPPNLIDVQSLDHVVYLHGQVSTDSQRRIAESVARQAPDVAQVVSSIAVTD